MTNFLAEVTKIEYIECMHREQSLPALARFQIESEFEFILADLVHAGVVLTLQKFSITPQHFYVYLTQNTFAAEKYDLARKARADWLADEIIPISDEYGCPMRARNRIDARRWVASKYKPKDYGDKIDLTVSNTVNVADALREANARRERGMLHPRLKDVQPIAQAIDNLQLQPASTTDNQSVSVDNPSELASVDPFS